MRKAAEEARKEAHEAASRRRSEAQVRRRRGRNPNQVWSGRLGRRSFETVTVRARGAAMEARRRARPIVAPVIAPFAATLARIAPYVSAGLLALVRIPAAGIALVLDGALALGRWIRAAAGSGGSALAGFLARVVTPVSVVAVVAAAAAIGLAVSQFFDYRGLAIDSTQYGAELGGVVSAPMTELETAGSAHLFVLAPLAAAALVLIVLTALGRWRLGRAVALVGVAGIAVSLLIDLPQGLEEGRVGVSYLGTEPQLLEGFWAQIACSAVLVFCGLLLGLYAKKAASEGGEPARRRRPGRRRISSRARGDAGTPELGASA
jgi:hypothetical protein